MYAACTDAVGGRVVEVPLGLGFEFPLDGRPGGDQPSAPASSGSRIPNNPTGQIVPRDAIRADCGGVGDALVFVDEAYVDFCGADAARRRR